MYVKENLPVFQDFFGDDDYCGSRLYVYLLSVFLFSKDLTMFANVASFICYTREPFSK
jgi:hypothetical protein